jgi:hypothetical protein
MYVLYLCVGSAREVEVEVEVLGLQLSIDAVVDRTTPPTTPTTTTHAWDSDRFSAPSAVP